MTIWINWLLGQKKLMIALWGWPTENKCNELYIKDWHELGGVRVRSGRLQFKDAMGLSLTSKNKNKKKGFSVRMGWIGSDPNVGGGWRDLVGPVMVLLKCNESYHKSASHLRVPQPTKLPTICCSGIRTVLSFHFFKKRCISLYATTL